MQAYSRKQMWSSFFNGLGIVFMSFFYLLWQVAQELFAETSPVNQILQWLFAVPMLVWLGSFFLVIIYGGFAVVKLNAAQTKRVNFLRAIEQRLSVGFKDSVVFIPTVIALLIAVYLIFFTSGWLAIVGWLIVVVFNACLFTPNTYALYKRLQANIEDLESN